MMRAVLLSLALQAWAASQTHEVTPVEKVVMMLREIQDKTIAEGHDEAVTYDKFACFCKAKTDEKSTAIKEYELIVKRLRAKLDNLVSLRANLNTDIDTCNSNIKFFEEELANATTMRKNERIAFEAAYADMEKAIRALESAIATLKGSKTGEDGALKVNYVQHATEFATLKSTLSRAVDVADALGLETVSTKAKAFLQSMTPQLQGVPGNYVPRSDYDYHSGDIISTLEDLLKTFRGENTDMEAEEVSAQASFDSAAQAKKDQTAREQETLDAKEKKLADTTAQIAATNTELTDSVSTLNDDRTYLKDLTAQCEEKARIWDQRSSLRKGELAAITQALSVIEGAVKNQASLTGNGARTPVITTAVETGEDDEGTLDDITGVSFVQTKKPDARVTKVLSLLRTVGKKLHSHTLSVLATKVQEDPFAKVKTLIQELIERLLTEAADEANQKGWCDTETQKAEQDRDYRVRDLDELEATLMELYGRKGELEDMEEKLTNEIKVLNADYLNATQVRQEEKAENEETVQNSEIGEKAVNQALDILSHFYGEAKQATVPTPAPLDANFTDGAPEDRPSVVSDAPDAGFDEAYTGAQSASTGVIGMLEVIRGDFQRTIKDTTLDEENALRAYVDYERENRASRAQKQAALTNVIYELKDTNTQIGTDLSDYSTKQGLLDGAIDALEGLHPVCQGSEEGMSYEDRVQRRKDEIEALKSALCILDDGEGDYCGASFLQKKTIRKIA